MVPFEDNTTIVTYSVMFYYTPEFAAITPNIPDFIDQVISETNQGYINSQIPLRTATHCIEEATINDISDSASMMSAFENMKGTVSALRNSADAAVLLVGNLDGCGRTKISTYDTGNTLSVLKKSCGMGWYSHAWHLAHNFGAFSQPEFTTNTEFPYGHAHLIEQGTGARGYRTIASNAQTTPVNYYSNPAVILPATGTSTGVEGVSNNAAVFIHNRFTFAAIGDESSLCPTSSNGSFIFPPFM